MIALDPCEGFVEGTRPVMAKDENVPAKPKRRDPERTRARLLEVATREFAEHGYEGARVDRIVRAARCRSAREIDPVRGVIGVQI
jgi:hypothetical protein